MCHQVVEKVLKAYWCVCRDDDPPFIHDHKRIAEGCGLYTKMSEDQKNLLALIRDMNIEARYQETKDAMARTLNSEITAEILEQTKQLYEWKLQKMFQLEGYTGQYSWRVLQSMNTAMADCRFLQLVKGKSIRIFTVIFAMKPMGSWGK